MDDKKEWADAPKSLDEGVRASVSASITKEEVGDALTKAITLDQKAELNNVLARSVMGWSIDEEDPFRLWRDSEGNHIKVVCNVTENEFLLCAHPWIDGVNQGNHWSFNPALNHHKRLFDFKEMLLDKLKHTQE